MDLDWAWATSSRVYHEHRPILLRDHEGNRAQRARPYPGLRGAWDCFDANVNSIVRYLMEVMQYPREPHWRYVHY